MAPAKHADKSRLEISDRMGHRLRQAKRTIGGRPNRRAAEQVNWTFCSPRNSQAGSGTRRGGVGRSTRSSNERCVFRNGKRGRF